MHDRHATAERGQTMAEYAVTLGVITAVILTTMGVLAGTISGYLIEIIDVITP